MQNMYCAIVGVMSIGQTSFRQYCPTGPKFKRGWMDDAVAAIEADQRRTADTHLIRLIVPALSGIDIYLKDEFNPPDRQPQAPPCQVAVSLCTLQWAYS